MSISQIGRKPIDKEQTKEKLQIHDLIQIEKYEKECFWQMLKLFAKENNLQKVVLETDIRKSVWKEFKIVSGITLNHKQKSMVYLCFERPSQILYVSSEKNIKEEYLQILQVYQGKILNQLGKQQTREVIYTIEMDENSAVV